MNPTPEKPMELKGITRNFTGQHLSHYGLHYKLNDGHYKTYEVASRHQSLDHLKTPLGTPADMADGVSVIVTNRKKTDILLLREFRPAVNQWVWRLPEGMFEPGEYQFPDICATREVFEETGIKLIDTQIVTIPGYANDAIGDTRIVTVFGLADARQKPKPQNNPLEPIEAYWINRPEALKLLRSNVHLNARLQLALLWFTNFNPVFKGVNED